MVYAIVILSVMVVILILCYIGQRAIIVAQRLDYVQLEVKLNRLCEQAEKIKTEIDGVQ